MNWKPPLPLSTMTVKLLTLQVLAADDRLPPSAAAPLGFARQTWTVEVQQVWIFGDEMFLESIEPYVLEHLNLRIIKRDEPVHLKKVTDSIGDMKGLLIEIDRRADVETAHGRRRS
jgi:hypothetical protein